MNDDPVMSPRGFGPAGATRPGQVPDGPRAPGEWTLSRWRVTRGGAAEACAEVAVSLTRLGAAVEDRAHAVAAMWDTLRSRLPTSVTFSLTSDERDLTGVLAVGEEIVATMRLADAPAAPDPARVSADGQFQGPAEVTPVLLDIIAGQDIALDHHRQELERTDRGLLALHAELVGQAEQLALSGQRQQELLATEQGARAGAEAAREAAEAARARLAFLSHVGAVLGASLDHRQVVSRLSTLLVPRYAGTAAVWLADDHGGLERHGAAGGARLDPAGETAPPDIVRRVLQTRRTQKHPAGLVSPDQVTVLAVPLVSLGTVLGVLVVTSPSRPFAHDDVIIVSEVAGRAAAALANALRFEQEREVAERLQHAMLTELPVGPGVDCAARYLPAVTGLNVGGDWYDAFCRPDGTLILAVGDVAGHGLAAAALMGQLRTAMRAYAMDVPEPGEVLTRLHALIRHIDPDHCATATLAMVSPDGQMRIATAGHPPPLLREPDGAVRRIEYLGPMLGLPIDHSYTANTLTLRTGSMLLFYTDGLIERREAIIDVGIDQLAAAFRMAPGSADQVADVVCEVMLRDSSREDDTCLLVCELTSDRAGADDRPPAQARAEPLS